MSGPREAGIAALRRSFSVAPDALVRAEAILALQHDALAESPPPRLPDEARLAATSRLRGSEVVVPRERHPVEPERAARLFERLGSTMAPSAVLPSPRLIAPLVEEAAAAAALDDAASVGSQLARLDLPPDVAIALLREALKPELLQTTLPLAELVSLHAPESPSCPACHSAPAVGTVRGDACCRWCGTCWGLAGGACWACGASSALRETELRGIVGGRLRQCRDCAEVLLLFDAPAEPLSLSMHGILAAPFQLAARLGASGEPSGGFAVF